MRAILSNPGRENPQTHKHLAIKICERNDAMKESTYKSFEELPLFLSAITVGEVLGISPASSYELLHESGFPTLKIGNRLVVPKAKFIAWVEENTAGGDQ